jgi:hypothetical protein
MVSVTSRQRDFALGLPVVVAWLVLAFFCRGAFSFLNHTSSRTAPPPGSASASADVEYARLFQQRDTLYPFPHGVLIVARNPQRRSIWAAEIRDLSALIVNGTLGSCPTLPKSALHTTWQGLCWWRQAHGIHITPQARGALLDSDLVSPDNRTATLVLIEINNGYGVTTQDPKRALTRISLTLSGLTRMIARSPARRAGRRQPTDARCMGPAAERP